MTHKLYFGNPMTFEFTADVIELESPSDDVSYVVLDKTYFYPTGGGQSHDTGLINGHPVTDVRLDGDAVVHTVQGLIEGNSVQATIDEERRWRNMQTHTGQHILSAAFVEVLGANTVSVTMHGGSTSTVDVDKANIDAAELADVETLANRIIFENRTVTSYFVTPDAVPHEEMRRSIEDKEITGDVRIVEIEDFDVSACAGTHVPQTGMLGMVKILKTEHYKGGTRVYFAVGYQALDTFRQYQTVVDNLQETMTTGIESIVANVGKLLDERSELRKQVDAQRQELLSIEVEAMLEEATLLEGKRLVKAIFEERDGDEIKLLGALLHEKSNVVALMVNKQGDDATVAVSVSGDIDSNAGKVLRSHLSTFGGHGGGNVAYAQGICREIVSNDAEFKRFLTSFDAVIEQHLT